MMNGLAIALVLWYLGVAVVFTPAPPHHYHPQDGGPETNVDIHAMGQGGLLIGNDPEYYAHNTKGGEPVQDAADDSAMERTKKKINEGYEQTADTVISAKDSATDSLSHGYHRADPIGDAKDSAKEILGNFAEKAKQEGSEFASSSKEKAASAISSGGEHTRGAVESLRNKIEKAKQASEAGIGTVQKKLEEKSDSFVQNVQNLERHDDKQPNHYASHEQAGAVNGDVSDEKAPSESRHHHGVKEKLGDMLHGVKDKLTGVARRSDHRHHEELEKGVHEFCAWVASFVDDSSKSRPNATASSYGDRVQGLHTEQAQLTEDQQREQQQTGLNVSALRESYMFLLHSAVTAIQDAKNLVAQRTGNTDYQWTTKFFYLSDLATGAVERGTELFNYTVTELSSGSSIMWDQQAHQRISDVTSSLLRKVGTMGWGGRESSKAALDAAARTLYLGAFCCAYGVILWMSFISGHVLSKAVSRQQLGLIQSKLFPIYLRLVDVCVALCLVLHASISRVPELQDKWQLCNWGLALLASLVNTFILEPRTTKLMFEKLKLEKEEGRGQSAEEMDEPTRERLACIDAKFRWLHQCASCLNVVTLAGLSWHLWYLANRLAIAM